MARAILTAVKDHLGMDVAWVSSLQGNELRYDLVSGHATAAAPEEGTSDSLDGSYCRRVLTGELAPAVADARAHPGVRDLEVTERLGIGAYLGVPVRSPGGGVTGMLCCTSAGARPDLAQHQVRILALLAEVLAGLALPGLSAAADGADATQRVLVESVDAVISGAGRHCVYQPIVDLESGRVKGFESLLRVEVEPYRPDLWLGLAHQVGRRLDLEVAAARTALEALPLLREEEYLSINLSAQAIVERLDEVLADVDPAHVVVELTEHEQVADYAVLMDVLRPALDAGLRLAIDDAGAGYASFRHVLRLAPAMIKADLDLVRDIDEDPARQALLSAMLTVARSSGASLVAEGVETASELACLVRLGVGAAQGYHLARPGRELVRSGFPAALGAGVASADSLSYELGRALHEAADFPALVYQALEVVLRLTGLETSYVTVLNHEGTQLDHRWVRNAGSIELPERLVVPWEDSLCRTMRSADLLWTGDPGVDLAECRLAADFGLRTFLSVPIVTVENQLIGTLCAGARQRMFLSDRVVTQLQLVAHVLSTGLRREREAV